jgi:hypothetical protein
MSEQNKPVTITKSNALGGVLLIVLGIIFLVGQIFDFHLGRYLWPFTVIVPGVVLFLRALALEEEVGKALAIISGIVTMVGVILFVQSLTDLWANWSYAWALVAPTGPGLGLWLLGTLKDRADLVKSGKDLIRVGLSIFMVAAVFFELVIGVSGHSLGNYGLPQRTDKLSALPFLEEEECLKYPAVNSGTCLYLGRLRSSPLACFSCLTVSTC